MIYNFGIQNFWSLVWKFRVKAGQTRVNETESHRRRAASRPRAPERRAYARCRVAPVRPRRTGPPRQPHPPRPRSLWAARRPSNRLGARTPHHASSAPTPRCFLPAPTAGLVSHTLSPRLAPCPPSFASQWRREAAYKTPVFPCTHIVRRSLLYCKCI
jgi:hypothetical protein